MPILLPPVPPVPKDVNPTLTRFLSALKIIIETREGSRASGLYKFLTAEDMGNVDLSNNTTVTVIDPIFDSSSIAPPTNFLVQKGTYHHYLSWTNPADDRLSSTEVYWNTANNLSTATMLVVVTAPQNSYANLMVVETADRYYWIRARTFGGGYSPWRPIDIYGAPEGFLVEGDDSIESKIDDIMLELSSLDETNFVNGRSPFLAGTIGGVMTVGLNGNMVVDGTLLARHIAAGNVTATHVAANQIITTSANIGNAVITEAKIANLAVTNAKIANLSVTAAKIADLTVTDAKIANATISSAKIATLNAEKIVAGTITTDKLIGGAITTSASSYSALLEASDNTTVTVCSVTFTTTGGPVVIWAYALCLTTQLGTGSMLLRMDSGTALVSQTVAPAPSYPDDGVPAQNDPVSFVYRHVPAAGSHTWDFRITSDGGDTLWAKNAGLVVMELKK